MKTKIKTIAGNDSKEITFPDQFKEIVRQDLIKRAVLSIQSNNAQPYGNFEMAGMQQVTKISRRRRDYKTSYGHGISRVPRKIMSRNGTRMNWVGALASGTVGGREAHPPKAYKVVAEKINKKEKRKAIRCALSASIQKELVEKRGHKVTEYPLVIENKAEDIEKTKDVIMMLQKIGLTDELERASVKTIRAGKGKMRGRKYKKRKGPLIVVSDNCPLIKAAKNIPGVDIVEVRKINAELLAPGAIAGRLTIYTESSLKKMEDEKLFTNNIVKVEAKKK
jgi:large subunit ribosomal protein L4e